MENHLKTLVLKKNLNQVLKKKENLNAKSKKNKNQKKILNLFKPSIGFFKFSKVFKYV